MLSQTQPWLTDRRPVNCVWSVRTFLLPTAPTLHSQTRWRPPKYHSHQLIQWWLPNTPLLVYSMLNIVMWQGDAFNTVIILTPTHFPCITLRTAPTHDTWIRNNQTQHCNPKSVWRIWQEIPYCIDGIKQFRCISLNGTQVIKLFELSDASYGRIVSWWYWLCLCISLRHKVRLSCDQIDHVTVMWSKEHVTVMWPNGSRDCHVTTG